MAGAKKNPKFNTNEYSKLEYLGIANESLQNQETIQYHPFRIEHEICQFFFIKMM